ncbi:AraC family transcriptional regulator [Litchfieldella qijiaojingensis]|uniref:AraC family transcriptional regulator n=1 Tax=Litchfieldella qijiaojingensis TaxID=980347 RepID=A0ABQ2ZAS4_9GAMM|nr:AraC family transcriptional regulator [Halomonas qijiaojingensis]GGY08732.1 AraC family transcriptional regulator [Halomonas qijiaojingensis]
MKHRLYPTFPTLSGNSFESLRQTLEPYHHSLSRPTRRANAPFQWRVDVYNTNGLTVLKARCSDDWSFTYDGNEDNLGLLIPRIGRIEASLGNQTFSVTPGHALLAPTPLLRGMRFFCDNHENSMISLNVAKPIVTTVLDELSCDSMMYELDYNPVIDLSQGIGPTLGLMIRTLIAGICESQTWEHSPQAMKKFIKSVLHLIFENMPDQPAKQDNGQLIDITPRHVKVAIDFMHANLHRPLTVTQIAEIAGVSARALQTGFQRHRNTSPLRYLRNIRLEAVHEELSSPENQLGIGEVALKWGFTHFGRFSAEYKAAYGQYPSETVKRMKHSRKAEA